MRPSNTPAEIARLQEELAEARARNRQLEIERDQIVSGTHNLRTKTYQSRPRKERKGKEKAIQQPEGSGSPEDPESPELPERQPLSRDRRDSDGGYPSDTNLSSSSQDETNASLRGRQRRQSRPNHRRKRRNYSTDLTIPGQRGVQT